LFIEKETTQKRAHLLLYVVYLRFYHCIDSSPPEFTQHIYKRSGLYYSRFKILSRKLEKLITIGESRWLEGSRIQGVKCSKDRADSFLIGKFVPDASDGEDILRFFFIFFYSQSQAADMNIHRPRFHKRFIPPDIVKKLIPRVDPAGMLGEES
jgi:hypothetical protein